MCIGFVRNAPRQDRASLLAAAVIDLVDNVPAGERYELLVNLLRDEIADIEMEVFANLANNMDQ